MVVANITNANDDTGTYSAAVNWGDGSAVAPATVAISGTTGTVSGASHTYARAGTFTVTTLVANADGATDVVSKSVTVSGPTITKFSKTSIVQGKTLTTAISGSGFTSGFKVTTSNSGIKVVSVTLVKATKTAPATLTLELSASKRRKAGSFNLTLSEAGGANTTFKNAIKVVS